MSINKSRFKSLTSTLASFIVTGFISIGALTSAIAATNPTSPTRLESIAAIVNNEVITNSELNETMIRVKQQYAKANYPIRPSALKKQVLQSLIYRKLQLQMAKHLNVTITDSEVNKQIAAMAKHNRLSVAGLRNKLHAKGISFKTFKRQIHDQIIISMLERQAISSKVSVSKTEANDFYKKFKKQAEEHQRYHLVDILVPLDTSASKQRQLAALADAKQIVAQLNAGAKPQQLVKKFTSATYQDLGLQTPDEIPQLFMQQLAKLNSKLKTHQPAVAGPLHAANGLHIIKLLNADQGVKLPTKAQAEQLLYQQKFQKAVANWLEELRKTAYVKIMHANP